MDGTEIEGNEYDPTKAFIDSDTKDDDNTLDTPIFSDPDANASKTNSDFDHICDPCAGSKSTRVVIWNKSMTPTKKMLEEVHADL